MATAMPPEYDPDWFTVSFDDDYERIYRWTEDTATKDVDGILKYLELPKWRPRRQISILDLGCGWGRHAIPLAQKGYAVTGVDLSDTMLHHARERADSARLQTSYFDYVAQDENVKCPAANPGALRLIHADMRDIPFVAEFDVVLNLFTSFGYFSDKSDNEGVLSEVWKALRPGGKFLIDVNNPTRYTQEVGSTTVVVADAHGNAQEVRRDERLDLQRRRRVVKYRFENDGRDPIYLECALYDRSELQRMLEQQRFTVADKAWGDFSGMHHSSAAPRLIMIAKKPKQ